jgi:type VI secretion system protein ImpM
VVVPLPDVAVSAIFLFGKLPAHGDFVCRGLDAGERDALDDWLSAEMAAAKAEFGDGFEAAFDAAPPWRFAWPEAEACTAGAFAPSVDAVGRRFPVILGRRGLAGGQAAAAAQSCEAALFGAMLDFWSADRLLDEVAASPLPPDPPADCGGWWVDGGEEAGIKPLAGRRPPRLICAVLGAAGAAA